MEWKEQNENVCKFSVLNNYNLRTFVTQATFQGICGISDFFMCVSPLWEFSTQDESSMSCYPVM